MIKKQELSRYVSEFVGTFILVAAIKLSFGNGESSAFFYPFTIGMTLMMLVYNYGYISLAMFNPAVTLAQIFRDSNNFRRKNVSMWISYLTMQFAGGIAGGFFGSIIGGDDVCRIHAFISEDVHYYQAFLGELLFTAILCSLNLHLATDKRVDGNQFYGISIAACLFVSLNCISHISGSALNPAVWVGLISSAAFCGDVRTNGAWIYWLAHLCAAWLSGVWFMYFYGGSECFGETEENDIDDGKSAGNENSRLSTKKRRRTSIYDYDSSTYDLTQDP